MLFRFLKEEFLDREHKTGHWGDHVKPPDTPSRFELKLFPDADKYEKAADEAAAAICRTSDPRSNDQVVGFIGTNGHYYKYNKKFNTIVSYTPDKSKPSGNLIHTFFPPEAGIKYYIQQKDKLYAGDIPYKAPPKKKKKKKDK